jgi:hypothetical protein
LAARNWLLCDGHGSEKAFALFDRGPNACAVVRASLLNFTKSLTIAGIILAEVYLVALVLAPNASNAPNVPLASALSITAPAVFANLAPVLAGVHTPGSVQVRRIAAGSLFFIPFGAAVGMGAGLLATGLANKLRR